MILESSHSLLIVNRIQQLEELAKIGPLALQHADAVASLSFLLLIPSVSVNDAFAL